MIELEKAYDASIYEADIYQKWMDSGYFNPDNLPDQDGEPYSIALPPPNVTGTLHLGHAFEHTVQDVLIRYQRMHGKKTLWVPGTDHAAIATQSKVEKILEKEEGKRKTDLGREEFLKRVESFAQDSHDTIVNQLKAMGSSLDWSREAYTLDAERNLAVRTAFKAMYDDELIYRGYK
ncbi:MAG: class I tRNA ligase family protein, partial [bacterium]|nr:class I tRNA ligase family protein [bacterium]